MIVSIRETEEKISNSKQANKEENNDALRQLREEANRMRLESIDQYRERVGNEPYIPVGKRALVFLVGDGKRYRLYSEQWIYVGERAEKVAETVEKRLGEFLQMDPSIVENLTREYRSRDEMEKAERARYQEYIRDEKNRARLDRQQRNQNAERENSGDQN